MAKKYIDTTGLTHVFSKLKSLIAGGTVTTEGTGAAYTATVPGISELTTGVRFTMIPHTVSTTTTPTLNVNGLGSKRIRQPLTTNTGTVTTAASASWLTANKPVEVRYDGEQWEIDIPRPSASTIYGTVAIENGGTGANNAADARANLGVADAQTLTEHIADTTIHVTAEEKNTWNNAAPMWTYSQTDLTAGTSALETGHVYLVYE